MRSREANSLAATSGERSTRVLGRALRLEADLEVRLTAVRALERVGSGLARGYVERVARDSGGRIGRAAEQALAAWPPPVD
jgi:hypothetical protein